MRVCFLRGCIPINPFMAFGFFLSDRTDRDFVRQANDTLVMRSDELWVFGQVLSNGVLKEISIAANREKPIRFFSIDDRPQLIQELHVDDLRFEDEVRIKAGKKSEGLIQDLRRVLPPAKFDQSFVFDP